MRTKLQHPQARYRTNKTSSDGSHLRRRKTRWAEVESQ